MHGFGSKICVYFLFFSMCYLSILVNQAGALAFDYNFSDGNRTNIEFEGDVLDNNTTISLTRGWNGAANTREAGRISYNQSVPIWDSSSNELTNFATHFSFMITSPNVLSSDGLAFFLSAFPSKIPPFFGGGYLGLVPNETYSSKNNIVAVEIDTFSNTWDPQLDYTIYDHIGIDINTVNSTVYKVIPKIKFNTTMNCSIYYNGTTKILTAFLYGNQNMNNFSINTPIDLRSILPKEVAVGLSAATGDAASMHQILSWSFSSTLEREPSNSKRNHKNQTVVGLVIGVCVLTILVAIVWYLRWYKGLLKYNQDIDDVFEEGSGPRKFSYNKLVEATNNFAEYKKLGQGGFGSVYRGFLKDLTLDVAIKKVPKDKEEGKKAYISEVNIISRLRHRNLVQLIGWCHDRGDFLLVYELMPEGSLDTHLYDSNRMLTWPMRYKIATGLGSALLYLHNDWDQCVLHRDIKPSNVMLDSEFNAKLGDFGLARFIDHNCSQATLSGGTLPYLAPECFTFVRASKESDVYSFGVVLLEIASGRPPVKQDDNPGKIKLVNWVWNLFGRNDILEAADERLNDEYELREMECMLIVGLWCAHPNYNHRPSMKEALSVLNFESPLPILPRKMPMPVYDLPADDFEVPQPHLVELTSVSSSSASHTTGMYSSSSTGPSSSYSSSGPPKPKD